MKFKKLLRFVYISLLSLVGIIIIFLAISIAPTDRAFSYDTMSDTMTRRIDAVDEAPVSSVKGFQVGFAKVNLTPAHPVALGGYGKRRGKFYESVHDSIYVRSLIVDNGIHRVAIVSADLLFIPPTVTSLLEEKLKVIGFTLDNTYMTATHSHNSIGSWGKGAFASILYGSYDDSIVHFIADKITASILEASRNVVPSTLKAGAIPIPELVYNRVTDGGPVDPLLRAVEIHRSDSSKLVVLSYTAHATCLFSRDLQLSGDYPGKLTQILEAKGYSFAMFMAGAVGSHGPQVPEGGWNCIDRMADHIAEKFLSSKGQLKKVDDTVLEMHRVALDLPSPRPKILDDWSLRPWLFKATFGDYPAYLTVLRMGNVVMLGAPCDFSGEFNYSLDSVGTRYRVMPMVTSFNGAYIGYVTPVKYFDVDHSETQLMNWFSPGNGEYVEQSLEKLLVNVAQ
jgi:neutral ceramidase